MSALIPAPYAGLVDDAAVFPPGSATLEDAVTAWSERTDAAAALVGSLVLPDDRLGEADRLLTAPTPVSVVLGRGAGGIEPVARLADRLEHVRLAGLELALRDEADLPGAARRVVLAVDQARSEGVLDEDCPVYVELPQMRPTPGWLAAADEISMAELRLKLRTGGLEPDMFPGVETLASWITAALDRETPFKCTAGLHHAVRRLDEPTGAVHHGFLNVLVATRTALDLGDVHGVLSQTRPEALLEAMPDADALARTRRWFTGFGSCSIEEPLADLHELGLLEES